MPTNLYGPGDNYHPEYGHVPAALIRRFHEAKVAGAPNVKSLGQVERGENFSQLMISPTPAYSL